MEVLIIEPEKAPRLATIDDGLSGLQSVVGGYIQAIYPYEDPVALICNDEGKLLGLPLNRHIEDYDIIAGTFLICGLGEEDFRSITPEMAEKYSEKFADPELFMRVGGRIVVIPMKNGGEEQPPKVKPKAPEMER